VQRSVNLRFGWRGCCASKNRDRQIRQVELSVALPNFRIVTFRFGIVYLQATFTIIALCQHICYHLLMLLVLDTNVLFMALYSSKGASFRILQLIRDGEVQLALSIPTFSEYQNVLLRQTSLDTLKLEHVDVEALLEGLAHLAFPFDIRYLMRPNLRDEADNMFVDLAFASSCDCIVTSNVRDFTNDNELKFDGFRILTPAQFIKEWEESND